MWGIADDDTLIGLADAKSDAEKISEAIKHAPNEVGDSRESSGAVALPKTSSSTFGADRMQKACFMSKCRQKSAKV